jgi:hypothetical protein
VPVRIIPSGTIGLWRTKVGEHFTIWRRSVAVHGQFQRLRMSCQRQPLDEQCCASASQNPDAVTKLAAQQFRPARGLFLNGVPIGKNFEPRSAPCTMDAIAVLSRMRKDAICRARRRQRGGLHSPFPLRAVDSHISSLSPATLCPHQLVLPCRRASVRPVCRCRRPSAPRPFPYPGIALLRRRR